jgi:hypothetical protein
MGTYGGGYEKHQRATSRDETQDSEIVTFHAVKSGNRTFRRTIAAFYSFPANETKISGRMQRPWVPFSIRAFFRTIYRPPEIL